jgi:hypothetical protein
VVGKPETLNEAEVHVLILERIKQMSRADWDAEIARQAAELEALTEADGEGKPGEERSRIASPARLTRTLSRD